MEANTGAEQLEITNRQCCNAVREVRQLRRKVNQAWAAPRGQEGRVEGAGGSPSPCGDCLT